MRGMDAPPIQYARTEDGVNIAYRAAGSGNLVLYVGMRVGLRLREEYEPYRAWMSKIGRGRQLVDFDWRGFGWSQQGGGTIGHALGLEDLETVAAAADVQQFTLFGVAGGGLVAVRYAHRHPERVSRLVLYHTSLGLVESPMMKVSNPVLDDPAYHRQTVVAAFHQPREDDAQLIKLLADDLHREAFLSHVTYPDDVRPEELVPDVPTLVLHARDFGGVPLTASQEITAAMPNARLVIIPGGSLIPHGESAEHAAEALETFLSESHEAESTRADAEPVDTPSATPPRMPENAVLTPRELDVLRLIALGRTNAEIADALVIRPSTVSRHVHHILEKTKAKNRAGAVTWAFTHRVLQD
jgi:pimeloyl-ACP methyl ester carboxylesterase/DNA-binding CsgD family transcriptional regulator